MPITISNVSSIPALQVVGDEIRPLVQSGSFELFELTGPEGSGPPPHAHPWQENYLVLDGELELHGADGMTRVGVGQVARIPADTVHHYRICSPTARFLVLTSGDAAGRFFEDMHRSLPPGPPTPETMATLVQVARRNQLTSPLFS
jgi:quercetin dioxygenase-like cupin family protein